MQKCNKRRDVITTQTNENKEEKKTAINKKNNKTEK
jgi:hypothetical protein